MLEALADMIASWIFSLSWGEIIGIIFILLFITVILFEIFMHEKGE